MRDLGVVFVVSFALVTPAFARGHGGGGRGTGSSSSSHAVRGYPKKSGTYVAPHRATNPDHTQLDNYSTKGNYNPSTGRTGTRSATH